jgi:putative spermidine/putrescine transport system substrate-binding protein
VGSNLLRRGTPRLGATAVTAAAAILLAACGGGSEKPAAGAEDKGPLVIASWGAYFTAATKKNLVEPFTKETGIQVQIVDAPGKYVANLQSQQKAGKMQWDLLDSTSGPDAYLLNDQKLVEPLPADLKSRLEGVLSKGSVTDFGFTFSNLGYVIACRSDKVKDCPADAKTFFDKSVAGRRQSVATSPLVNLSLAELASGVAPKDLKNHEINLDRAFAKLKEIKPEMKVWWQSGDQMEQAYRNGEVDMGIAYSGRAFSLNDKGTPMKVVWNDGLYNPGFWNVVKGSQHTKASFKFLEWVATHPENQAGWAKDTGYSVPNPKAFDYMTDELKTKQVDWPANREQLAELNYLWYVKNQAEVNKRWQEFLRG